MNETILIVDDEASVRGMMRGLLGANGYHVVDAESGKLAMEVVKHTAVDLVITDLKMPGMDGLTLAQKLLEQDSGRPVLLMTAYADLDSARKAVRVGVYEYFTKPFDVNDVLAGIRRALEHRRLVLENREYQKDLERKVVARTRELQQRMRELEARDALLRQLLSLQEPEETLGSAVKLALDLCACDNGALYLPDGEGKPVLRAAAGFVGPGATVGRAHLGGLGLERTPDAVQVLHEALENRTPVWVHDPGEIRKGFGIHSFGVLPVVRGDEVIALLEVGRKRKDVMVGEMDLEAVQGFLPYVAMAVADCRLQEELPEWEGDVEQLLDATEKWME